jgi:hypothetical protein
MFRAWGVGYVELGFAGDLAQFPQAFDLLLQLLIARLDTLLPLGRKLGDNLVEVPAHLTFPSLRLSGFLDALRTDDPLSR